MEWAGGCATGPARRVPRPRRAASRAGPPLAYERAPPPPAAAPGARAPEIRKPK